MQILRLTEIMKFIMNTADGFLNLRIEFICETLSLADKLYKKQKRDIQKLMDVLIVVLHVTSRKIYPILILRIGFLFIKL